MNNNISRNIAVVNGVTLGGFHAISWAMRVNRKFRGTFRVEQDSAQSLNEHRKDFFAYISAFEYENDTVRIDRMFN